MQTFMSVLVVAASYLIGSIPVGLLLVRISTGQDVRQIGSGRVGGTNTLRAAGPWIALITIMADLAKGFLSVLLARVILGAQGISSPLIESLAGLTAVVGHNYSIFIGFKGGAGTMTSGGGALALWPWNLLFLLPSGVGMIVISSHASVGSITIAILIPIIYAVRALLGEGPWEHLIHGLGTMILTLWSLRPNIQRLWQGRERRITLFPKKDSDHRQQSNLHQRPHPAKVRSDDRHGSYTKRSK